MSHCRLRMHDKASVASGWRNNCNGVDLDKDTMMKGWHRHHGACGAVIFEKFRVDRIECRPIVHARKIDRDTDNTFERKPCILHDDLEIGQDLTGLDLKRLAAHEMAFGGRGELSGNK